MWLTKLVEGTDYYISFIHKHDTSRTYRGRATFLYHAQVGTSASMFDVGGVVVTFPHHAVIHEM